MNKEVSPMDDERTFSLGEEFQGTIDGHADRDIQYTITGTQLKAVLVSSYGERSAFFNDGNGEGHSATFINGLFKFVE